MLKGQRAPLVKELPAPPVSRGTRFVQLLCDHLHRLDVAAEAPAAAGGLEERVAALEEQVRALAEQVRGLGGG